MGHSAGAHLVALVGTDKQYLEDQKLPLTVLKGVIPLDTAVYDLPQRMKDAGPLAKKLYEGAFGSKEADWKDASPMSHIQKKNPPFLVVHVADRKESREQSEEFVKALKNAGVEAKVYAAEGKTHGTLNRDLGQKDDKPTTEVFEFLKERLKSQK